MFYSINICNFAAELIFIVELNIIIIMKKNNKQESTKIRINENLEMDINDMLPINSIEDLGEVDTFEEFFKYTDDALNGK